MRRLLITAAGLALLLAAWPATAGARSAQRQAYAGSARAVLPSLYPYARLRASERSVTIRARTVRDATVRIDFQVFCLDRSARVRRSKKSAEAKGTATLSLRVPRKRGYSCSASASVRTPSRPAPPTGAPAPIRLSAAMYAHR